MFKLRKQYLEVVKWIFRYLNGIMLSILSYDIMFNSEQGDTSVVWYIDLDYAGDMNDMRYTRGYVFSLLYQEDLFVGNH